MFYGPYEAIYAGLSLSMFKEAIRRSGGKVFVEED